MEKLAIPVHVYRPMAKYFALDATVSLLKSALEKDAYKIVKPDAAEIIAEFSANAEKLKAEYYRVYLAHAEESSDITDYNVSEYYKFEEIQELMNADLTADLRLLYFTNNFYESWD